MAELQIVNPVRVEDAEAWLRTLATTFLGNPYDDDFAERVHRWTAEWLPERTWGVRAAGRWVATLASEPRMITVPGTLGSTVDVHADALTAVTVAATHRRRGLLSRMIGQSLTLAKDHGHPVSILIAAEWPIYGRYGYAPASWHANYVHSPRSRGGTVAPADGEVRQVDVAELVTLAPQIFDRARHRQPGQVDRPGGWWDRRAGQPPFRAIGTAPHWFVREGPDGPDGLVAWKPGRDFELNGSMGAVDVAEFAAASDGAYRDLWAYLSGIDVIGEINLHGFAIDEPLRWLLEDARTLRETYRGDDLWLRLLDVPAALSLRGYTGAGTLVLDVVDTDTGGYAAGRYRLEVGPDGTGECRITTDAPDLRLTQRALASTYLGGMSLRQQVIAGGVEQLTDDAVHRFDTLFATSVAPWNATGF